MNTESIISLCKTICDGMPDHTDNKKWRSTRRKFLTGVSGSALAIAGINGVLGGRDYLEIPIAKSGEEVIESRKVPRAWWEHVKNSRHQKDVLARQLEGNKDVRLIKKSFRGREYPWKN